MSSQPSTDSLDSLVLHDVTPSPTNEGLQGMSASNLDMEHELIAAAEALLSGQVQKVLALRYKHHNVTPALWRYSDAQELLTRSEHHCQG